MYSSFYIKSLIITASAATAATRDEELSGLEAIPAVTGLYSGGD